MFSKKTVLALSGSLIATSALAGVFWQQNASSNSYGEIIADQPVQVVAEVGGETILVAEPSQKQKQALSAALDENPELAANQVEIQSMLGTESLFLDGNNKKVAKATKKQKIQYKDSLGNQNLQLDLLTFDTAKGQLHIANPQSATPAVKASPTDASKLVFEKNFSLFILDATTMQVKALGDTQGRVKAYEAQDALRAKHDANNKDYHSRVTVNWAFEPQWAPNGKQIAFMSNRDVLETNPTGVSIWVHDVKSGKESAVLTSGTNQALKLLGWTAKGDMLVQVYDRINTPMPVMSIVKVDVASGKQQQIVDNADFVGQSDDLNTIVYSKGALEKMELVALNVATGEQQSVFKSDGNQVVNSYRVDFSADSKHIVTDLRDQAGQNAVLTYNLDTKQQAKMDLPKDQIFSGMVSWAGDKLVVPVENLKELTSKSFLMSVEQ